MPLDPTGRQRADGRAHHHVRLGGGEQEGEKDGAERHRQRFPTAMSSDGLSDGFSAGLTAFGLLGAFDDSVSCG